MTFSKEFWILMGISFVFYLLSTYMKTENLQNILIVFSGVAFIWALFKIKRSS